MMLQKAMGRFGLFGNQSLFMMSTATVRQPV
jgi:hypothetical protein